MDTKEYKQLHEEYENISSDHRDVIDEVYDDIFNTFKENGFRTSSGITAEILVCSIYKYYKESGNIKFDS